LQQRLQIQYPVCFQAPCENENTRVAACEWHTELLWQVYEATLGNKC
jgi:hypothetical protein